MQEARRLALACRGAQREFATASQADVDRICAAMATPCTGTPPASGRLAHEETGYGVAAHKRIKIEFASRTVWESIRDIPTVGVLRRDPERGVVEIGWPLGVIVGLCPVDEPELHRGLQGPDLREGSQRLHHRAPPFGARAARTRRSG